MDVFPGRGPTTASRSMYGAVASQKNRMAVYLAGIYCNPVSADLLVHRARDFDALSELSFSELC